MIRVRNILNGDIRTKWRRAAYEAGYGPFVPFGPTADIPAYQANFTQLTSLPDWLTASRAGNATYCDSSGLITWAPANMLLYSNDMTQAAWTAYSSALVTTANSATAPDGTNTANTITLSANARVQNLSVAPGVKYIFSGYLRTDSGTKNITIGDINQIGGITTVSVDTTWKRYSFAVTKTNSAAFVGIDQTQGSSPSTTGTLYAAWWQLEPVTYQSAPATYLPTVATGVYKPRFDYDPVTLANKGLLIEPTRTNIILQSQNFTVTWFPFQITPSATGVTAPDGTNNGNILALTGASAQTFQSVNVTAGTAYTASIWLKGTGSSIGKTARFWIWYAGTATGVDATKDLVLTDSWQRISVTSTPTGSGSVYVRLDPEGVGTATAGESVHAWGVQMEAGTGASSYLHTTTGSLLRAADLVQFTSGALTTLQGSTVTAVTQTTPWLGSTTAYGLLGYGFLGRLVYAQTNTSIVTFNGTGATTATIGSSATLTGSKIRAGVSWNTAGGAGSVSLVANNGTVGTSGFTFSISGTVYLGSYDTISQFGGCVESLALYATRLTDYALKQRSIVGAPF